MKVEAEELINDICDWLFSHVDNYVQKVDYGWKVNTANLIVALKQYTKKYTCWKPNHEQMEALGCVMVGPISPEDKHILQSLYNDLWNLKSMDIE